MIKLEHIAEVFGAGEPKIAVQLRVDRVVTHILAQRRAERCGHRGTGQMLAGDADRLAAEFAALLENAVGAPADILSGDPREFLVAHGKRDRQLPIRSLLGAHAEVDEVVPVERSQQEGGGNGKVGEDMVCFALGIEMRHLVLAHQGGHAVVTERNPPTGVFEGRPDNMLQAGVFRRLGHGGGIGQFLLGRKMGPEEGDAIGPVSSLERALQALDVVYVCRHHLSAPLGQLFRLIGVGVSGEHTRRKTASRIAQDGASHAAALRAGCPHDNNDLLSRHVILLVEMAGETRCRLGFCLGYFRRQKPNPHAGPHGSIVFTSEKFRSHLLVIYFAEWKRFSISAQLTTFHHAPTYSLRRFWYLR